MEIGKKPTAWIECINTGKTLAVNMEVSAGLHLIPRKLRESEMTNTSAITRENISRILIAPGGTTDSPVTKDAGLTEAEHKGLIDGSLYLYVKGVIYYEDTSGGKHETTFCYWLRGGDEIEKRVLHACGYGNTAN